jgi:hypothetical protein
LSVDDSSAVEGPAVELADDEAVGESLDRRIELRHERLESAGWEAMPLTRLRMLLGLTKLRMFLQNEEDLDNPDWDDNDSSPGSRASSGWRSVLVPATGEVWSVESDDNAFWCLEEDCPMGAAVLAVRLIKE